MFVCVRVFAHDRRKRGGGRGEAIALPIFCQPKKIYELENNDT